jgi:D-tyrosyl-tRNA(Tyr) deacylase
MRLVVQRVAEATVLVQGRVVGAIQQGLLVLLGIHRDDQVLDIPWFIHKLVNLRIFSDDQGKMNLSVKDVKGKILIVSQFTLYANYQTGRRPDFLQAASPSTALPLYKEFIEALKKELPVECGEFGANMQVSLINDGPVTLVIEIEKE